MEGQELLTRHQDEGQGAIAAGQLGVTEELQKQRPRPLAVEREIVLGALVSSTTEGPVT